MQSVKGAGNAEGGFPVGVKTTKATLSSMLVAIPFPANHGWDSTNSLFYGTKGTADVFRLGIGTKAIVWEDISQVHGDYAAIYT